MFNKQGLVDFLYAVRASWDTSCEIANKYHIHFDDDGSPFDCYPFLKAMVKFFDLPENYIYGDDLNWFCWELDFGRAEYAEEAMFIDDIAIDLSSIEKFVEYFFASYIDV